jgi:thiol-disulfide isomerase/thioredoxin
VERGNGHSQKESTNPNNSQNGVTDKLKQIFTNSKTRLFVFLIIALLILGYGPRPDLPAAPDFTLTALDDTDVTLSNFKGNAVLLEFMASWCSACRKQSSEVLKLHKSYGNKVVFITISVDPNYDTVNRFSDYVDAHNISWLACRDTNAVAQRYEIEAIPTLILIDPNQQISWQHTGWASANTLSEQIENII